MAKSKEFERKNKQVDMTRLDNPYHGRDGHERITLRFPPAGEET
jgi:hypothetical protein